MDEFELTFLPRPEIMKRLEGTPFKEMLDIYIPSTSKHPNLRIRKSGSRHEMTKKQPAKEGDASHQIENTIPLTLDEFNELSEVAGKRVSKKRYAYEEGGFAYEVDVFTENLQGLVLVDIEFTSAEEKSKFNAPSWILREVTQEDFIAGGMLCGKKYEDIEEKLESFGYTKI